MHKDTIPIHTRRKSKTTESESSSISYTLGVLFKCILRYMSSQHAFLKVFRFFFFLIVKYISFCWFFISNITRYRILISNAKILNVCILWVRIHFLPGIFVTKTESMISCIRFSEFGFTIYKSGKTFGWDLTKHFFGIRVLQYNVMYLYNVVTFGFTSNTQSYILYEQYGTSNGGSSIL